MVDPFSKKKYSARSLLLLAALMVLAFVGNYFALRLFTGFNYLLGSIAVMIVLRLFGIWWALLAALLASSCTILLFGHPYAVIWLCCEIIFVGLLFKRGTSKNLVLYDALYWPLVGAPLIWIIFRHVMQVPPHGTVAALLTYWVIGVTNALVASLILTPFSPKDNGGIGSHSPSHTPIKSLIFNLLMAIVTIPAVIVMIFHMRSTEDSYLHELNDDLTVSSRITNYELRLLLRNTSVASTSDLHAILQRARFQPYHQLTLTDSSGRVLASTNTLVVAGSFHDPLKNGIVQNIGEYRIVKSMPLSSKVLPLWQRDSQSIYIVKTPVDGYANRVVIAETPFAPYQNIVIREQINSLLFLLFLNLLTLFVSIIVSRRLMAPLRILSQMTTDLPERLMREKITSWPVSRVAEVDQLIANFRDMSLALSHRFHEITYINETLELRVEERTRELSKANAELQKEIQERQLTEIQRDHLMDELVNQVRFLQTLIDAIPNPIFYKDINGLYQGCNRAFEEKWGLSREEIVGKTVYDLFPQHDAEIFDRADHQLYGEGGVQVYETAMRYHDDLLHSVIFYKATYQDMSGETGGLVGTVIDISDRIKAETDCDRLMVELRHKNKELEGIVYVASHDLRSPLVNVQGFSRRLAKNCTELQNIISCLDIPPETQQKLHPIFSESIPKALGYITGSIEKMDALLNGLLRLSRLGRSAICFEQIDMQMLVSKIVESLAFQIESVNARVEVGHLAWCLADAGQMSQVFSNLIDNAIKYRSKTRSLIVRVSSEELVESVSYCVEDNGMGIPAGQQDSIWEIFNRLDPNDSEGEGLGLTIVRRIIDRLGGSIRVESEPDVGSRFYVVMPKQQGLGL